MFPHMILVGQEIHHSQQKKIAQFEWVDTAQFEWPSAVACSRYEKEIKYKWPKGEFRMAPTHIEEWLKLCTKDLDFGFMEFHRTMFPHDFIIKNRKDLTAWFSKIVDTTFDKVSLGRLFKMERQKSMGRIVLLPHHKELPKIRKIDLKLAYRVAEKIILITNEDYEISNKDVTVLNLSKISVDEVEDFLYDKGIVNKQSKGDIDHG